MGTISRPILTMRTSSAMLTTPFASQSPGQGMGVSVGVLVGEGVGVSVGVIEGVGVAVAVGVMVGVRVGVVDGEEVGV
jgi:hypothetical protein